MSEYDFIFDPITPEEQILRNKQKEMEDFISSMDYEDMIIIKKYVLKHKNKFSKFFIRNLK